MPSGPSGEIPRELVVFISGIDCDGSFIRVGHVSHWTKWGKIHFSVGEYQPASQPARDKREHTYRKGTGLFKALSSLRHQRSRFTCYMTFHGEM